MPAEQMERLSDDSVAANRTIDERIREQATAVVFGRELLAEGTTAVALDEDGVLTAYEPDGTSSPVALVR